MLGRTPPATPSEPEGGAGGDPQRGQNDTGLQEQFSHLDAPNDSLYVLCGVVIAMLLVALIIVLLAVTISKLRKRDETAAAQEVVLHTTGPAPAPAPAQPVTIATIFGSDVAPLTVPSATSSLPGAVAAAPAGLVVNPITGAPVPAPPPLPTSNGATPAAPAPPPLLWQYPAPYSLYGTEQDAAVHGVLPAERSGFCRGFRRSLRGRWRRLVRRKPERDPYTLPAEVRDQLKQIYVY
ncbi:hypothetical protein R5R35_002416 [Gryllus longicercus]|uniref:Uncharacterized protein n=1 Tax=Gryllus longicercus TaxID=2509291 RepID=A0AAN9VZQ8_9ORTH